MGLCSGGLGEKRVTFEGTRVEMTGDQALKSLIWVERCLVKIGRVIFRLFACM